MAFTILAYIHTSIHAYIHTYIKYDGVLTILVLHTYMHACIYIYIFIMDTMKLAERILSSSPAEETLASESPEHAHGNRLIYGKLAGRPWVFPIRSKPPRRFQ